MYIPLSHPMESDCHAAVITELNFPFQRKRCADLSHGTSGTVFASAMMRLSVFVCKISEAFGWHDQVGVVLR